MRRERPLASLSHDSPNAARRDAVAAPVSGRDGATRIVIVDDHPLVSDSLRALVTSQAGWEVCCVTARASQAVAAAREHDPDAAIVDLGLEDGSGLELVKQLKACAPRLRILVYSGQDERMYAERAIRAGALGFVHKSRSGAELLAALRQVLAGRIAVSEEIVTHMVTGTRGGAAPSVASDVVAALSDRELEVFERIGRGDGVREIAERLHLSPKTVQNHRDAIRRKLNLRDAHELTRFAALWVSEGS